MTEGTVILIAVLIAIGIAVFIYIFDPCPICDRPLTHLITGANTCGHCGFWIDSFGEWHTK